MDKIAPDGTSRRSYRLLVPALTAVEALVYLLACGVAAQIVPAGDPQNGVVIACEVGGHAGFAILALIAKGRAKLQYPE